MRERRNTMKKQNIIVKVVMPAMFLALILVGAGPAQANEDRHASNDPSAAPSMMPYGMTEMPGMMSHMFKDNLKLNDKQSTEMHKLYSDYDKEMVKRGAAIQLAQIDVVELLEADKVDTSAVEKAVKKVEGLKTDRTLYRIRSLLKSREFLNKDQYEMFRDYTTAQMRYSQHEGGMHGMPGGMQGMPGGMSPGMPMMDNMMPGHEGTGRMMHPGMPVPGMMPPGMMMPPGGVMHPGMMPPPGTKR
jgi:Spy/CpxP family protein refolding chaperone